MREYFKTLCAFLLLVCCGSTEASVENGGYSVTVSFSQNIQAEEGKTLLGNLEESLKDASEVLGSAIGLRFAKVTVQIPSTWDPSDFNINEDSAVSARDLKSDFLVDGTGDVVFGKFPHAHQYGSCGVPGHQIVIPTAFLGENNTFPKGTALAREWLKYRYGVFDENGYLDDPLYPLYYVIPGGDYNDVKITDCTDVSVTYDFVDKTDGKDCSELDTTVFQNLNAGNCDIKPHNGSLENVKSSIMYYQKDIDTMQHICGDDTGHKHNSRSPNKQNAFCYGESIGEVVRKSSDLKSENTENAEELKDIEFTYVQEANMKLVVAWEDTAQLVKKKSMILNAVKQIMIDLPDRSQFAGFHFNSDPLLDSISLRNLDSLGAKSGAESLITSEFVNNEEVDLPHIGEATFKAFEILSDAAGDDTKVEGTIIVIGGISEASTGTLEKELIEELKNSHVCVSLMLLSDKDVPELSETFKGLPCANLVKIPLETDKHEETFDELYNSMRKFVLPSIVNDKESKMVKTVYLGTESGISVDVDDSVESVTFWLYDKQILTNLVLKINDEKAKIGEKITVTSIGDVRQMVYLASEPGKIELSLRFQSSYLTHTEVTSKAGKYLAGEVLIHDTTTEDSTDQLPVIIYAFIRYGAYPLQNARVSATILRPSGDTIEMDLNDDGGGDSDITKNDGIYSRYFTQFNEAGEYTVTVKAESNGELTSYGVDENADYKTCCGSYIREGTPKLTSFSKEFVTTFTAKSGRPDVGYKPSRILDLRIENVDDDKVTLTWTAPGEEGDIGTAHSYEIKHFATQEEAIKNFDDEKKLYTVYPQERGETENFAIKYRDFNESGLYYIAIKAKNNNNTSDLSNIIEISVPDVPTKDPEDEKPKQSSPDKETVGIIVGVIVAVIVLIILIYLAIYFVKIKPKRKEQKKQNERNEAPTSGGDSSTMNSVTFIPASTIMEHHNEKTQAKLENKEPPIFKEEDFEDRNPPPQTNEPGEGARVYDPPSDKVNRNGHLSRESLPPKSPKRMTPV